MCKRAAWFNAPLAMPPADPTAVDARCHMSHTNSNLWHRAGPTCTDPGDSLWCVYSCALLSAEFIQNRLWGTRSHVAGSGCNNNGRNHSGSSCHTALGPPSLPRAYCWCSTALLHLPGACCQSTAARPAWIGRSQQCHSCSSCNLCSTSTSTSTAGLFKLVCLQLKLR